MYNEERVTLNRDCAAIQVPSGTWITVPAGSTGVIMQSLGGTYTVGLDSGDMVRIEGKDGDALGKEPLSTLPDPATTKAETAEEVAELVWDQLRTCYDPEIPINIADLGLVYGCAVAPLVEGGHRVEIKMTLTAPACGMGDVLKAEVESKVERLPGVKETDVELVFEPPWDYNMIPDAAKLTLGMM
jgi:probable FeS assembly SUF system protein SufT